MFASFSKPYSYFNVGSVFLLPIALQQEEEEEKKKKKTILMVQGVLNISFAGSFLE